MIESVRRRSLSRSLKIRWVCYVSIAGALFAGTAIYLNGALAATGVLHLEPGSSADVLVTRAFPSYLGIELAIPKAELKPRPTPTKQDLDVRPDFNALLMPYAAESAEPIAMIVHIGDSGASFLFEDGFVISGPRQSSTRDDIFRFLELTSDHMTVGAPTPVLLPAGRAFVHVTVRDVGPLLRGVTATVLLRGPINFKTGSAPYPWNLFPWWFFLWPIGALAAILYGAGLAFATFRHLRKQKSDAV